MEAEQDAFLKEASAEGSSSRLRPAFQNLKTWISGAYYSSEPGMRELGWTESSQYAVRARKAIAEDVAAPLARFGIVLPPERLDPLLQ